MGSGSVLTVTIEGLHMKYFFALLSVFCLLWANAVWATPPFPQGYVLPHAQALQPGQVRVTVIATSLKDKKRALYLPQAFPGKLAVSRDGTLYMAGGMSGGDSPLMRITPDGKAARLLKPQFISIAAAPQRGGQDVGEGSVFGRLGQMFEGR